MHVSVVVSDPLPAAVVVVRTTLTGLAQEQFRCLRIVRAAAERGAFRDTGRRVTILRKLGADGTIEASIGICAEQSFPSSGELRCVRTPTGRAATATHEGPPDGLAAAHTAVLEWARDQGAELAGVSWEITEPGGDANRRRTHVYHLLDIEPSVVPY